MPNSLIKRLGLGLATLGLSVLSTSCNQTKTTAVQANASANTPSTEQSLETTKFENIEINVISLTKPVGATIANHARDFEALTGAKIVTRTARYNKLYQTVAQDLTTGKNQYDVVFITTNWMPDYVESGYLKDLTELVNNDPNLAWEDIAAFYRKYGNVYNNG